MSSVNETESLTQIVIFLNHLITNSGEHRRELFSGVFEKLLTALLNVIPKVKNLLQNPFISLMQMFLNSFTEEVQAHLLSALDANPLYAPLTKDMKLAFCKILIGFKN